MQKICRYSKRRICIRVGWGLVWWERRFNRHTQRWWTHTALLPTPLKIYPRSAPHERAFTTEWHGQIQWGQRMGGARRKKSGKWWGEGATEASIKTNQYPCILPLRARPYMGGRDPTICFSFFINLILGIKQMVNLHKSLVSFIVLIFPVPKEASQGVPSFCTATQAWCGEAMSGGEVRRPGDWRLRSDLGLFSQQILNPKTSSAVSRCWPERASTVNVGEALYETDSLFLSACAETSILNETLTT